MRQIGNRRFQSVGGGTIALTSTATLTRNAGSNVNFAAGGGQTLGAAVGTNQIIFNVAPGTLLTMELDKGLTLPASLGERTAADRNIYVAPATSKSLQRALSVRNYYTGDASGTLDRATRDAIARFQLDQGQLATGDADEATVKALGVAAAALR